jgi:S-(hydroxymethyl)glutathione dehydrogenase/alcohol dehydrogenase
MSVQIAKAVVVRGLNEYSVEEVTVDPPKAGEIKVKMKATGVCHSDLSMINGTIPCTMPVVIGHEGAGIVEELGDGVTQFEVGDHVVLSFIPFCGECHSCHTHQPFLCTAGSPHPGKMLDGTTRVRANGEELGVMTQLGCMSEYSIVPAVSAVKMDKSIAFDKAALVGCGVMTGVGAAINTAKVTPGSSVVVFGCGGIGLSIIQGARLAGAGKVIAVDLADNKLEMASNFGATHTINSGNVDPQDKIMELTIRGADFAFEAVGQNFLMELAYACTRRGGTTIIVGVGSPTKQFSVDSLSIGMSAKTIKGCMYGSANPPRDFPMLLDLYQAGKLNLDDMVSKTYSIDDIHRALNDMEANANARGVLVYD